MTLDDIPSTNPTMPFQDPAHFLTGNSLHTSTSSTRAFSGTVEAGTSR
jgi:hypothetical protein